MRFDIIGRTVATVFGSLLLSPLVFAGDSAVAPDPANTKTPELRLVDPSRKCETQTQPDPLLPHPSPPYPDRLRKAGVRGTVTLQGVITIDGTIRDLSVVGSADAGLARIAVATVSKWRYRPSLCDGKPVEVFVVTTATFKPF